jgi:hypothetical protein
VGDAIGRARSTAGERVAGLPTPLRRVGREQAVLAQLHDHPLSAVSGAPHEGPDSARRCEIRAPAAGAARPAGEASASRSSFTIRVPWAVALRLQPGPAAAEVTLEVVDATEGDAALMGKALATVADFGPRAAQLAPTAALPVAPLLADRELANAAELRGVVAVVQRGGCNCSGLPGAFERPWRSPW